VKGAKTVIPLRHNRHMDNPLAGPELLSLIRGIAFERPLLDPDRYSDVLLMLENAAGDACKLPAGVVVRVTKSKVNSILRCERGFLADLGVADDIVSPAVIRGQLLDYSFAQVAVGTALSVSPTDDALSAAEAAGDLQLLARWDLLSDEERDEVRPLVDGLAKNLAERWPNLPDSAYQRLQENLRVSLADGRVLMSGRLDLVLALPAADHAASTLIDVKGGKRGYNDNDDAWWYAVLETLRHSAQPFQVGNYYLSDGYLALQQVTRDILLERTARIAGAVARLVALALGADPSVTPNPLCERCPEFEVCTKGRVYAEDRGLDPLPARWDEFDENKEEEVDEF
jgi:hypothetical protein